MKEIDKNLKSNKENSSYVNGLYNSETFNKDLSETELDQHEEVCTDFIRRNLYAEGLIKGEEVSGIDLSKENINLIRKNAKKKLKEINETRSNK